MTPDDKPSRTYTPRGSEGATALLSGTRQPVALIDALDAKAARLGLSRSQAVRAAMRAWVDGKHPEDAP